MVSNAAVEALADCFRVDEPTLNVGEHEVAILPSRANEQSVFSLTRTMRSQGGRRELVDVNGAQTHLRSWAC